MKKYIVAAGSSVLVLLVVLLIIIITEDKTGPIITFSEGAIVFREGEAVETLLEYATARDSIDGDVTDSLVVASVVPLKDQTKAKVTFAAKDSNNNITKEELIVDYNVPTGEGMEETDGEGGIIPLGESDGENGETTSYLAQGDEGDVAGEEDLDESENSSTNEDSGDNVSLDDNADSDSNKGSYENDDTDQNDDTANNEEINENDTNNTESEEDTDLTYPRIKLNTNEVKLERGSEYDALSYVESCEDDEDSSNTVWGRIRIVGTFDMDKRGNYVMMYYTTDLDGNKSNMEYLWIEVY